MMWASVRRKVLSGSSTTYLVLEQSLPGTCFMAPLSRSYSNPLKVEENMRLRTELQKKIQELEKYVSASNSFCYSIQYELNCQLIKSKY
ncbi:uncharacterized protein LOC110603379 isoform X6 [Manihot esculenta]|nr:uncharacterized protein LOC110603379 isoform X6 [Manihot esculenta]